MAPPWPLSFSSSGAAGHGSCTSSFHFASWRRYLPKEMPMASKPGRPPDDPSSAPESGTVCDETSGNRPSDRANAPQHTAVPDRNKHAHDGRRTGGDPSEAGEEP
jgi:hypothetical protein